MYIFISFFVALVKKLLTTVSEVVAKETKLWPFIITVFFIFELTFNSDAYKLLYAYLYERRMYYKCDCLDDLN